MFKTGPTHLLGRSYADKDPRIDSGFTLYYMGMNIGSFVSALCIGEVQKYFGWRVAFLVGGVTILLGLVWYFVFRKSAYEPDSAVGKKPLPWKIIGWVSLGLAVAGAAAMFLISHEIVAYWVFGVATVVIFVYFIFEILRSPKEEKSKIIACLILILMGFVFFVLYQQAYTSILLFINRCVVRTVMGFEIPAVAFFALNPAWVIILGPILAWTYTKLGKKNKDLPVTVKFPIGLLVTTLMFFTLVASSYFTNANYQVSAGWAVAAYFFYTLGEMLVSALGVAMVTHIAPKRMYGIMMGTWFVVGMALSSALSGVFASRASIPDTLHDPAAILAIYNHAFLEIGIAALVVTSLAFAIGPYVKRIAKL
jgi:POT family proton-dependent oligopeptide transporter